MEEAVQQLQSKDTKERMAGVERLQGLLEYSRKALSATEVANLVDASLGLLKDNNFRVCQGALQALASAAALAGEHLKVHFNSLLPAIVERLGDSKQPVRDAARRLLLALMEISSPAFVVERCGLHAWQHRNWRVREEFARTAASAISMFATSELLFQRLLLPPVLSLLEDSNNNVREAAILCLEEMYRQGGSQFKEELQRHSVRPAQLKEIGARFEKIIPKIRTFVGLPAQLSLETKHGTTIPSAVINRRDSPKARPAEAASHVEADDADKPVELVHVSSERELMKEIDKVTSMLTPDQDWSVRIAAMQRVEGLVAAGVSEYACFPSLLKQLGGPLCLQLSDRRSSIVKQACHLLNLLSKELLSEFESSAEFFIPVLFKLVVITVQVIAESADNCIRTLLRNCRVSRILPRIVDCAKSDRNAVLRARCCEYASLVLERWGESPEVQRAADLYEDLIKCCVGDAMSEVRSIARSCYRLFAKTWPDRSRRLFMVLDSAIQRLINEEDGGFSKRYASPFVRERHARQAASTAGNAAPLTAQADRLPAFQKKPLEQLVDGNVQKVPPTVSKKPLEFVVDKNQEKSSGQPVAVPQKAGDSDRNLEKGAVLRKHFEHLSDKSLENVLQASHEQVSVIETMLKGLDIPDKSVVSTTSRFIGKDPAGGSYRKIHAPLVAARVSVDPPSSRDPPYPASASATGHTATVRPMHMSASFRGPADASPFQPHSSLESGRTGQSVAKRVPMTAERSSQTSSITDSMESKGPKRILKTDEMPSFQKPLLKSTISGRSSVSSRSSMDELQVSYQPEPYTCSVDGLMSLNDALTEGLSVNGDWSGRVAAFSFLRRLLQQGPRGLQEVHQNFEKVMKLFYEHLDDPHHKVAQAALSTLAELVPACRRAFEGYLERLLPRVFARLIDAKEVIRQLGTSALEIVGNIYSIEALLPALLRSLDEQRSPKAKMAVIEFAIAAFAKLALNGEAAGGSGLLKLWLAKLAPLANDRNPKLKETAVTGIISVYSHFDSATVLNFILGLSIEEQSILRRALKQYTPRIEVDLMTYLQHRNQRGRPRPTAELAEAPIPLERNQQLVARNAAGRNEPAASSGTENGDKRGQAEQSITRPAESEHYNRHQELLSSSEDPLAGYQEMNSGTDSSPERRKCEGSSLIKAMGYIESDVISSQEPCKSQSGYESLHEEKCMHRKMFDRAPSEPGSSRLMQKLLNWGEEDISGKCEALQEVMQLARSSDIAVWSQYSNQFLASTLHALDDPDPAIRELAVSVIPEMLSSRKGTIDAALETVLEKLVATTRDGSVKASTLADRCLSAVMSQCDPQRCLCVLVPLLVGDDDNTLVTCISCLTKLVTRLPQEELMAQLPSFLPALFDAFGNQNADVRKAVVFCLVDIYIVLGKSFVPYLGSLSSTQLRLVTMYANRISQARTGTAQESLN